MWQFGFGGPDMERLVAGRERIYTNVSNLDRFWNEFSLNPERFEEGKRQHYAALYAMPGAIRAGFAQFAAFGEDALDSKAYLAKMMATVMRFAATNVHEAIVPDSGHWMMEENPAATTKLVTDYLTSSR
jgi:pimeloyl-ACP methyl ester carboxylesterase